MTATLTVPADEAATGTGAQYASVALRELGRDVLLRHALFDDRGVLLLAAGARLTQPVLERLARRGVMSVRIHRNELARVCPRLQFRGSASGGRPQLARVSEKGADTGPRETGDNMAGFRNGTVPFLDLIPRPIARGYSADDASKFVHDYDAALEQLGTLFHSVSEIRSAEMDLLESLTESGLKQMARDIDLFVSLGLGPEEDRYPVQHSQQSAMLAMAIGANRGLKKGDLLALGMGCLAHDVGMLKVRQEVVQAGVLDETRFLEIKKHPAITFDMMRQAHGLAGASRLVAYQMHERNDGSGYPRGRSQAQIHPLSRIAAVADVFTALISPRRHRASLMPYYAMEHLLKGAQKGRFDIDALRGLLHAVSLFPIGSYVELSDGRVGQVIRANREHYSRPIVAGWNRACLEAPPEIIDLLREPDLQVRRPLPGLPGGRE